MAKNEKKIEKEIEGLSFWKKYGVPAVKIKEAKEMLALNIKIKVPFILIGIPGIGKTDLVKQHCIESNMRLIIQHLSHKMREDYSGIPFPCPDAAGKFTYLTDARLPQESYSLFIKNAEDMGDYISFVPDEKHVKWYLTKKVSNHNIGDLINAEVLATLKSKEDSKVDASCEGLFFFDEFNRADAGVTKSVLELLGERKSNTYRLPKDWTVGAAINPVGMDYDVNDMDGAFVRRFAVICTIHDTKTWLNWALTNKERIHETVLKFIQSNLTALYDHVASNNGTVYANPASWEKVSKILFQYDKEKIDPVKKASMLSPIFSQYIGEGKAELLTTFITDKSSNINFRDILYKYTNNKPIQDKISEICKNTKGKGARYDILSDIAASATIYLSSSEPDPKKIANNIVSYLCDIPTDCAMNFVDSMGSTLTTDSGKATPYNQELTFEMGKDKRFGELITKIKAATNAEKIVA